MNPWQPYPGLAIPPLVEAAPPLPPFLPSAPAGPADLDLTHLESPLDQLQALATTTATHIALPIGPYFYVEVAKFRAARLLAPRPIYLHAIPSPHNKSEADPYLNLVRLSTEALSARLGRADQITLTPFHFPPHLAANVLHILNEESHLPPDAVAGSHYIDTLTAQLLEAARQ